MARKAKPKTTAHDAPLVWTAKIDELLVYVFEGQLTHEKMSEKVGVTTRTIERWKYHPDFQAKLAEMREDAIKSCELRGVAFLRKEQRIIGLAQMAQSARDEYVEKTWVQEERPSKDGPVFNESYNDAAFACFRGALDDIAKELGHRKTISEVTGKDGKPLVPDRDELLGELNDEEFAQLKAIRAAAQARAEAHGANTTG